MLYSHGSRCFSSELEEVIYITSGFLVLEEGGGFYSTHPLTAVSTHEEHHFPVSYDGVSLNPSVCMTFSRSSSLSSLV